MTLPLAGCRVLDLGIITAGAGTSALLADLGADVIKVESPTYRDPFRGWTGSPVHAQAHGSPFFYCTNRNKRGISINLKSDEGRDAFLRLASKSDIVVENFRRGVLRRLRLGYGDLRTANPAIILASISSQGETGPDADYVSYGSTLEAMGGMAWLTRYAEGTPVMTGRELNYPDQVAAIFAAGMILTAWRTRKQNGEGAHLDLSQRELTSFLCGDAFVAASAGAADAFLGNEESPHGLQDCFLAADGRWIAMTVEPDRLADLAGAVGARDASPLARLKAEIAAWARGRGTKTILNICGELGIAAAPVAGGTEMMERRTRLWDSAFIETADHMLLKGFPFQIEEEPLTIARGVPEYGADTKEVLREVGGFSDRDIARLIESGAAEAET